MVTLANTVPLRGLLPATAVHAAVAAALFYMGAAALPDTPVPVIEIMLEQPAAAAAAPASPGGAASPPETEAEPVTEAAISEPLPVAPKPRPRPRAATAPSGDTASATAGSGTAVEQPGNPASIAVAAAIAPVAAAPVATETPPPSYAPVLLDWLGRHRDYPRAARLRRQEGTPQIALTLDRDGRLLDLTLVKPSGVPILDQAALDMARRAAPFPPPLLPRDIPHAIFVVPIRFALDR